MAVFSTIGSIISTNSQNKNNKAAAQISQDNNAANIGLARESRDMSLQRLDPYNNRGNVAGNQINALLGLGGSQVQGGPANVGAVPGYGQPNALSQFQPAGQAYGLGDTPGYSFNGNDFGGGVLGDAMGAVRPQNGIMPTGGVQATGVPQAAQTGQTAQQAAEGAFDIFRNSTGYQFRLGEGMDAVTSAYAGIGGLQSGAAMRGINEYGQNFASNEFGNYMNALGGQQAVGAGAASSGAGVTQNFASNVMNSNNFNAQNQMSARLGQQNAFANGLGTFGGIQQKLVGSFIGAGGMG